MDDPIRRVEDWHELFSRNPGVVAFSFLLVGFLLREIIQVSDIFIAWLRQFLRIERRTKNDSKSDK